MALNELIAVLYFGAIALIVASFLLFQSALKHFEEVTHRKTDWFLLYVILALVILRPLENIRLLFTGTVPVTLEPVRLVYSALLLGGSILLFFVVRNALKEERTDKLLKALFFLYFIAGAYLVFGNTSLEFAASNIMYLLSFLMFAVTISNLSAYMRRIKSRYPLSSLLHFGSALLPLMALTSIYAHQNIFPLLKQGAALPPSFFTVVFFGTLAFFASSACIAFSLYHFNRAVHAKKRASRSR